MAILIAIDQARPVYLLAISASSGVTMGMLAAALAGRTGGKWWWLLVVAPIAATLYIAYGMV